MSSPLASPVPWDLVSSAYAEEVTPSFEAFARHALRLAGVGPGARVVDVACGPGTLALLAQASGAHVSALDFSPRMIAALRARPGGADVDARVGDGTALPFEDASFDAGFSMFGLMFFPDRAAGFRELRRVLRPGARAVVSSWVSPARAPPLMALFEALAAEMPVAPKRPPVLEDAAACSAEMGAAGFSEVEVHELAEPGPAGTAPELLAHAARAMAPVALLRQKLGAGWDAAARRIETRLVDRLGTGRFSMELVANLTVGRASGG